MIAQKMHNFDPKIFLAQFWQQKPLFLPRALPNYQSPIQPDELAGLACEPEVESRIVARFAGPDDQKPWHLRHGPFEEEDFQSLPDQDWTLLVQDVDKFVPEVANLLSLFRFLPSWRLDDIMISYAEDGGSVGPHWDEYDVFLIQVQGQRRWKIDTKNVQDGNRLTSTALRIMERFEPEQEWLSGPGDILYIPPRVGHYGVAEGPCMTFSVGFRAPDQAELFDGIVRQLSEQLTQGKRFSDPERPITQRSGELDPRSRKQLRELLHAALQAEDAQLDTWIATSLSECKPGFEPEPERPDPTTSKWMLHPAARCLYFEQNDTIQLATCGKSWTLSKASQGFVHWLCHCEREILNIGPWQDEPEAKQVLDWMTKEAWLEAYDESAFDDET